MRRIQCVLLAAVVAIGFASIASAADMPAKAPVYRAPVAVAPVWNWSGIYIGGHAGGAWANTAFNSNSFSGCAVFTTQCDPVNSKASGGIGGGQIGVRWQSGTWVYGLESTFAAASLKVTGCSGNLGCATAGGGVDYPTKLNSLFTSQN